MFDEEDDDEGDDDEEDEEGEAEEGADDEDLLAKLEKLKLWFSLLVHLIIITTTHSP